MHFRAISRSAGVLPGASAACCRPSTTALATLRAFACSALVAFAGLASAAGNVVELTYDAAGNITQIRRQPNGSFGITSFDPTSGAIGAAVTIYGSGFSATPANNTVKFNGHGQRLG